MVERHEVRVLQGLGSSDIAGRIDYECGPAAGSFDVADSRPGNGWEPEVSGYHTVQRYGTRERLRGGSDQARSARQV